MIKYQSTKYLLGCCPLVGLSCLLEASVVHALIAEGRVLGRAAPLAVDEEGRGGEVAGHVSLDQTQPRGTLGTQMWVSWGGRGKGGNGEMVEGGLREAASMASSGYSRLS